MDDLEAMARTIYGEAKAHDRDSAYAVACVILNRVNLRNWPDTIREVCLQPWQFSCWNQNDPNRARIMAASTGSWYKVCIQIAQDAIDNYGKKPDPTKRSTHYHTPAVSPKWARKKVPAYSLYHHYYNDIDTPAPANAGEALDQQRPISGTRTVQGARVATVGVLASSVAEQLQPLVSYSDIIKYVFLGVSLVGIGWMVYARVQDRKEGLR